ncbi:microtubule-associated protein futsch isoform X2 [Trematomus bernacchii]|uniref:microtubule-associated protein futsch isoform X2 n=1 Tax=Trematomus bernacchii TaxID=40690 RepID=UPI00146B82C4|nr:microtubule-associated protein futsch isoform X2 [Trematomus bernacchii]
MAVAYGAVSNPGLLYQQYPPPLLPKPGKDNVRLQKLLKRSAKKKASAQASQPATLFRSNLSPVNEASPDLEHSDHSTPPKTPETPFSLFNVQEPPRFTVRPLYRHVASPYPHRAAYGRPGRFSPQTVASPLYSYPQNTTIVSSYSASTNVSEVSTATWQVAEPAVPTISLLPASFTPEATVPAAEIRKPAFSTFADNNAGLRPFATGGMRQAKSPTPYQAMGGQALIRPLTVLIPMAKCRSPRPTFKATEPSRSPKPMFDVPKIRMYTASTSYYESTRTTPVYDTAALTAIGSTASQSKAPAETMQDLTPVSEVRRGTTPTALPPLLGPDPQRKTPTSEIKTGTTPTTEINTIITPTVEILRATPTSEIRVKTPTGRPRTPAYNKNRAGTPVFEVSRPNPLLFAISPITVEPERSRTPKTLSAMSSLSASQSERISLSVSQSERISLSVSQSERISLSVSQSERISEPKPAEMIPNGDIHLVMTPVVKPIQQSINMTISELDLSREAAPAGSQRPKTPTTEPKTPAVTSYSNQRPKTPTYEASRLMTTSPGFKRPRTPTYGMSPSPVGFQRPKTPTQTAKKSKSGYRGLTPAEYAAHGGIKTYSPAFGISGSKMQTEEEVQAPKEEPVECKAPIQETPVNEQAMPEVSKAKETPKEVEKPQVRDVKVAVTPSIPIIIVSQASDTFVTTIAQETSMVSSQVAAKQEKTVIQEPPKSKPPTTQGTMSQKPVQGVAKPKTNPPEVKPVPKGDDQDPLKAIRKLLGKDQVQKPVPETKADVAYEKEPVAESKTKDGGQKPSTATGSEEKGKDKKEEPAAVKSAPERKESVESLPAEALLKVMQKPKGVKSKLSGWSRLKKHMVVEQEEPIFPEVGPKKEAAGTDQKEVKKAGEKAVEKAVDKPENQDESETKDAPVAAKMWNACLFQMFSTKENIMHQIELNKSEDKKTQDETDDQKEVPSFAQRLPLLLFSPKFDAKRLKEAASRPTTKISTVFEMGLIGRKGQEEEPKDFNRTARGFAAT